VLPTPNYVAIINTLEFKDMNNYAVVKVAHRQYIVESDKNYTVDKIPAEVGEKIDLDVLLLNKSGKLEIGTPVVEGTKVTVEILEQGKGEKVKTNVFRAKARYRKHHGFRKQTTTFKVLAIK
jgi:large subunit ribosomal protein L21